MARTGFGHVTLHINIFYIAGPMIQAQEATTGLLVDLLFVK